MGAPTTRDEALTDVARWLIRPHELLAVAEGRREEARSSICSGSPGRGYAGHRASVEGRKVVYTWHGGPAGEVRIVDLLDLALEQQTPAKVATLRAALERWGQVHRDEHEQFGPSFRRTREVWTGDAWSAHQQRVHAASRALDSALDAWWDDAADEPVGQLELFKAAA